MKSEDCEIRTKLLQAALELFSEKGYASTSVREIVGEAGVTAPVLYYYFGNKEGLFLELMKAASDGFEAALRGSVAEKLSARERILLLARRIRELFRSEIRVARLVYAVFYGPPQGAPAVDIQSMHDDFVEAVGRIVADGVADGEFEPGNEEAQTWAVLAVMHIIMENEVCHQGCEERLIDLEGVVGVVLNGMEKRD